ncbi:leucine-rich repeat-containing protein 15-like [Branchiostoma floridae]|uniref:Leucine-rich repeat-containing protein 15-like n=2 Tax=Branchiostoma floridae TaxID=7739 RepID=A0A9J7HEV6_BRAFL|nr:leucine-rich repeat-containing protein 15-like [Branchiostoma floridae]
MGRKLRHMLMLLLIILKQPNMPEAESSCGPCSSCNLQSSNLTSIPQHLSTRIFSLDLKFNAITTLSQSQMKILSRYKHMTYVNFAENRISTIHCCFPNLPLLEVLYLMNNQITGLPPGILSNLPKLKFLYLSSNKLAEIQLGTFSDLPKLQSLKLNCNKIRTIQSGAFTNLPLLKMLYLNDNRILNLESGSFSDFPKLQLLWLDHNKISNIQSGAFSNLPNLTRLDLRKNQISFLPPSIYSIFSSISVVIVFRNHWQCDCRMLPFRLRMTGSHPFEKQILCVQPATFSGKLLKDIEPENLTCKDKTTPTTPVDTKASATTPKMSTSFSFGNTESKETLGSSFATCVS